MIDTETKRKSILGFGSGDLLPHPDGTLAQGDRLTLLWLYSGITADPPEEPVFRSSTYRPTAGTQPSSPRAVRRLPPSTYRPNNPISPVT